MWLAPRGVVSGDGVGADSREWSRRDRAGNGLVEAAGEGEVERVVGEVGEVGGTGDERERPIAGFGG